MNYAAAFEEILTAVNAFNTDIRCHALDVAFKAALIEAVTSAENNAVDTLREGNLVIYRPDGSYYTVDRTKDTGDKRTTEENNEFFRVAYLSISVTSSFESIIVREFFKKAGYSY